MYNDNLTDAMYNGNIYSDSTNLLATTTCANFTVVKNVKKQAKKKLQRKDQTTELSGNDGNQKT